jgi:protein SCO1/2
MSRVARMSNTDLIVAFALASIALLISSGARAQHVAVIASHDDNAKPAVSSRQELVPYVVPRVTLVRSDGKSVSLPDEMDDGRPVLLNFIYTSCGSTCPLMSQIFAQFQRKLGAEAAGVHIMSISIDPEEDTPARLTEYARKFGASPEWQYYTGTLSASLTAQRAFDVFRGDKMSHAPVTLLRAAPGKPWRRIDGFVRPDDLVQEYRRLLALM